MDIHAEEYQKPLLSRRSDITVIINPVSCLNGVDIVEHQLTTLFDQYGTDPHFVETLESCSSETLARQAVAEGSRLIVAAGGDGTIMEAANALIGTNVPLGIIPLGTGNLFALNLGIPMQIDEAVKTIMTGRERPIDLVNVNHGEHYFAIMGGIGFDARIMSETDRATKQRFGRFAYLWSALQNLEGDLFEARVKVDDSEEIVVEVKSILMANMGLIGPNFSAFPDAVPDDGLLRLGLLKASTAPEFLRLIATAMTNGSAAPDPAFDVYECRSVKIDLAAPQLYEYDGDTQGQISHLNAQVLPNAIKIMSPTT